MYTPKTPSDSTLESCMPSTERSRVCFGEFAIFCLVEIILYFVFAGCILINFIFFSPLQYCVNVRSNFLLDVS